MKTWILLRKDGASFSQRRSMASWEEPAMVQHPRTFPSHTAANRFLYSWLRGRVIAGEHGIDRIERVASRKRGDWDILECELLLPKAKGPER